MATNLEITLVDELTEELVEAFACLMPQLKVGDAIPNEMYLAELVEFPGSLLAVARLGGKIVGAGTLAWVYAPSGMHARIEDVIVDESARCQGIGTAITQFLLDEAEESGVKYVALTSNPRREAANRLYQKMGFQRWETNLYFYKFE